MKVRRCLTAVEGPHPNCQYTAALCGLLYWIAVGWGGWGCVICEKSSVGLWDWVCGFLRTRLDGGLPNVLGVGPGHISHVPILVEW